MKSRRFSNEMIHREVPETHFHLVISGTYIAHLHGLRFAYILTMKLRLLATIAIGLLAGCGAGSDDAATSDEHLEATTPAKEQQAAQLAQMMDFARAGTAWHGTLDWTGLTARGQEEIRRGDGTDAAFFGALFHSFMAIPEGHQGVMLAQGCGSVVPYGNYSRRGVCGRPHGDGNVVITNVRANNSLGLKKGDVVVGILSELIDRPMCSSSRPSASYAETNAAATIGDLLHAGETITVEAPDGTRREVVVPAMSAAVDSSFFDCQDPFGRNRRLAAEASLRPDGVAVIRVPGWVNGAEAFPTGADAAAFEAYKERFEVAIQAEFAKVKSAPAIVWDMRSNQGGLTQVGLDIVSGMPGAQSGEISYCNLRNAGSDPPTFDPTRYASYELTPGGRFTYGGKVAIITEGLNYSAADYFPLAVKMKTNALLVGAPTAGGFGAVSNTQTFAGPPSFNVSIDMNRCSTSADDQPLEGRSVAPHIAVGYDPKDLAANKDTVLERAAAEVKK